MSYKAPDGAFLKKLSFIISAGGDGTTGAYDGSSTATAFNTVAAQKHIKVTANGTASGDYITLPNNILIMGTEMVLSEAFTAYSTYSSGGTTGTSTTSISMDYTFGGPHIYYGTAWSNVSTQAHSSAGTKLPLVWALKESSGSVSAVAPFGSSYGYATGTFGSAQHLVVGTGGLVSLGYKPSSGSTYYGSAASATQNNYCATGKVEYRIYYQEL
jgi:hypothetical protein